MYFSSFSKSLTVNMAVLRGLSQLGYTAACQGRGQVEHSLYFFFGDTIKMNADAHTHRAVQRIGQVARHPGCQDIFAVSGQAYQVLDMISCFPCGLGACHSHSADVGLASAAYDLQVTP